MQASQQQLPPDLKVRYLGYNDSDPAAEQRVKPAPHLGRWSPSRQFPERSRVEHDGVGHQSIRVNLPVPGTACIDRRREQLPLPLLLLYFVRRHLGSFLRTPLEPLQGSFISLAVLGRPFDVKSRVVLHARSSRRLASCDL